MHKVVAVELKEFFQLAELFTQPYDVDRTELVNNDTTPSENNQENSSTLPHRTQTSSLH